jgi:hypothetical protein
VGTARDFHEGASCGVQITARRQGDSTKSVTSSNHSVKQTTKQDKI